MRRGGVVRRRVPMQRTVAGTTLKRRIGGWMFEHQGIRVSVERIRLGRWYAWNWHTKAILAQRFTLIQAVREAKAHIDARQEQRQAKEAQ